MKPVFSMLLVGLLLVAQALPQCMSGAKPHQDATCKFKAFQIKDRSDSPVIGIENITLFYYSDYFKENVPAFKGTIKNISDARLLLVSIVGNIRKKDGTVIKFDVDPCGVGKCALDKGVANEVTYSFSRPWPFTPTDFDSLDFTLEHAQRLTTKEGFHVSGFIAKDEGCFDDYLATQSLAGLSLRKKLAELLEYGCGLIIDSPMQALVLSTKTFGAGTKKTKGVSISLFDEGLLLGHEQQPYAFQTLWVIATALVPGPVLALEEIGKSDQKPNH